MNEVDDAILEFLAELGWPDGQPVVIAPKDVYLNIVELRSVIEREPNTISRRMGILKDHGLLRLVGDRGKHYALTDLGRRYVDGDVSRQEILE